MNNENWDNNENRFLTRTSQQNKFFRTVRIWLAALYDQGARCIRTSAHLLTRKNKNIIIDQDTNNLITADARTRFTTKHFEFCETSSTINDSQAQQPSCNKIKKQNWNIFKSWRQ